MSRIEISIAEYDELKDKIKELENVIAEKNKTINYLSEMTYEAKESLKLLINRTTWAERVFQWKKLIEMINPDLYKD